MGYELREHTADVAVEAVGESLGGVFALVADGMSAAMCEDRPAGGDSHTVDVTAESREALLFDYLDQLIYERDVRSVLPVDSTARIDQERPDDTAGAGDEETGRWRVVAEYRGLPLDSVEARDLKAVTYSQMTLEENDGRWRAYVVFDV